jgi:hypothetical protein|tara:strand:+ start:130 stop:471 length:342 start_codon:yes stop_codon:yes gene_type:complete
MKDKLHKLCIRLGWYREIYNGHFDIGKTLIGTHFIIGDWVPLTLKRCIELERGYHQESYMKMEHDVQQKPPSKFLIGAAALGAAFAASCEEAIEDEKITSTSPPAQRFDPPHS